jgi:hypothetical protein
VAGAAASPLDFAITTISDVNDAPVLIRSGSPEREDTAYSFNQHPASSLVG